VSVPIIYIGGAWRSGSTLLERMLASIPGFWPVGELVFVWEWGVKQNHRCGCGERFHDCVFWNKIGEVAYGGWQQVDANEAARLRATVDRHRNLDRIAGLRRQGRLAADMAAYLDVTSRLYQAVQEVSGASVIVDSSKTLSYALVLRDLPCFDLRLVHLVRRSHGVAHSWSKQVRKPGVGDGNSFMTTHQPAWSVGFWIADNLLYDALSDRFAVTTRLRYEQLVADPRAQLENLLENLGLTAPDRTLDFLKGAYADLLPTHGIAGNPMRFDQGLVSLRVDDEWRTSMSLQRRLMISAATWPLLKHYGYSVAPERLSSHAPAAPSRS
jgi:Sulfotransferase family